MGHPPVTAFAETAALYAIMREDDDDARRIIADMLPGERATLAGQLDKLRAMLTDRFGNDIGRTVAHTREAACGRLADPWHTVPCDFEAGHPTHTSHGDELLSGGCNSYGERPVVLDQVTRARREEDGTSPLSPEVQR